MSCRRVMSRIARFTTKHKNEMLIGGRLVEEKSWWSEKTELVAGLVEE